jgi:phosphate transport system permease protein
MLDIQQMITRGRRKDAAFNILGWVCTVVVLGVLALLLLNLAREGLGRINWDFLTSFPSRKAEKAGILSALVGSVLIILITAVTAVPLGVAAGVYLEEYAKKNKLTTIIEINITNLAGVPSIVYGLMALGLFVYIFHLGQSILAAGLTLACLILPIVIVATREALRAIPRHIKEAAYALGATRLEVVRHHLLPYSAGGIGTGVIIGISRAIGETAPLVTIGALTYIAFLPPLPYGSEAMEVAKLWAGSQDLTMLEKGTYPAVAWMMSPFTVLPIQMFSWVSMPGEAFLRNAAAAGLVLMFVTLGLNAVAILVRHRVRRRIKW